MVEGQQRCRASENNRNLCDSGRPEPEDRHTSTLPLIVSPGRCSQASDADFREVSPQQAEVGVQTPRNLFTVVLVQMPRIVFREVLNHQHGVSAATRGAANHSHGPCVRRHPFLERHSVLPHLARISEAPVLPASQSQRPPRNTNLPALLRAR